MEGYSKLASLMGAHPELMIFRRFSTISAQNLLYLQAELVHLEHEFQKSVHANQVSGDVNGKALISKDWYTLAHINGGDEEQWKIMLRIRAKLKEYGSSGTLPFDVPPLMIQ